MKKLLLTFAFICIICKVSAQNIINQASPALDKFVGTWIYNKNGKEVKILLKKIQVNVPKYNTTTTMIEGYHIYKENNKNIDNSVERNKPSFSSGYIEERDKPNKLKIRAFDILKNKSFDAIMIYIPGDTDKIQCTLRNSEGVRLNTPGEPAFDKRFTLPESMVLYKAK